MSNKVWNSPFDVLDLQIYEDQRGVLFEIFRFKDHNMPPNGQIYTFSINPNQRRGDHFHKNKQEWFSCVYGKVTILLTSKSGENKAIELCASTPKIVYTAPYTTHSLVNYSDKEAIIVSYSSTQYDASNEDTYHKVAFSTYERA